jgi:hypothetical protein
MPSPRMANQRKTSSAYPATRTGRLGDQAVSFAASLLPSTALGGVFGQQGLAFGLW